jgi:glycosyltransferase involved in cell wall biosynthesis
MNENNHKMAHVKSQSAHNGATLIIVTVIKDDLEGLKRTERSLKMQTMPVVWLIVTPSDNSTTFQYVNDLLNQNIVKSVVSDPGLGIYRAMNEAISQASDDEWIWFINAGDELADTNTYETVYKICRVTSSRWIYGGHYLGSDAGEILGQVQSPLQFRPSNQLFAKKYVSHQSTIFHSSLLKELGGFRSSLKIAADWDLMVRAYERDPGHRLELSISVFYMGGLSTVSRQIGNIELLRLRKDYLGPKYFLKNYTWFAYRMLRNKFVQSVESKFPAQANVIRKIRFMTRSLFTNEH